MWVFPGFSFLFSLLLTPQVRTLARRLHLVDLPDGDRKLHPRAIPVAGGPVLLVSACAALWLGLQRPGPLQEQARAEATRLAGLLAGGLVICAVGVADDLVQLRGRHKLLGQVAAAGVVIASGVEVRTIHLLGFECDLGILAVPFTVFLLIGAINSLNLMDGMDGLLSSVAFIICLALGAMALAAGNDLTACVALAMAGAVLGFLAFNFPPASVFLGDSGSMLIGLTVGVLAIHSSLKAPATVALATPASLLVIPIFDTTAAILRRKLTGRSICDTDRGHIHHCLLRRLAEPRYVLLVVSCCCLVTAAGAFAGLVLQNELIAVATAGTVVALLTATRLFGHAEFLLVKTRLTRLALSFFQVRGQGQFRRTDVRLQGTRNWKNLLDDVAARAFDLNLQTVRLDVSAPALQEEYHAHWDRSEEEVEDRLWRAEIPLLVGERAVGSLLATGHLDREPLWTKVAAIWEMTEAFRKASEVFLPRVEAFHRPRHGDRPGLPAVVGPGGGADGHPA
jgi:UDP-GlcNAc:undecaprenyl-phosphate GlcNAc-1-phosphate transferase